MKYCFAAVAALVMLVSCDQIIGGDGELIIDPVEDALLEQTVGSTAFAAEGVTFTTTGAWTSQVVPATKGSQPMWVSISPDHGDEAGTYTITISLEANDTGEDRKADIIITCGGQKITISITQVATEDVPSDGGEVQTPVYKKYVSKLEWDYTHYDGDEEKDVLTFEYDEMNRVVRMVNDYRDGYDSYNVRWSFNYSIAGEIEMTRVKTDEYETVSNILLATLDDSGRVSRFKSVDDGDDEGYDEYGRFEYNSQGYLTGVIWGDGTESGYEEEGVKLFYTDGLLSATQEWDNSPEYSECEREEMPNFTTMYANRYPNDKINIDLNPFIMEGEFYLEDDFMWFPARLCGKFSDCLMEIGGVYGKAEAVDRWNEYTTPNVTIPVKYTTVMLEEPEGGQQIAWTFDDEDCPLTATETFNYQEYEVTYDIVVGDTVIHERPEWNPETETEVMVKYYDYTTTPKQYTKTANSWSCPSVLKVTYRE